MFISRHNEAKRWRDNENVTEKDSNDTGCYTEVEWKR